MFGWNGTFLRVNLTRNKAVAEADDTSFAFNFLGGRGSAASTLWDQLKPGVDPLSPENKLVFAAGPLTGFGFPNSGKLVVAAKSPLTGGYGDGNIGTNAAVQMRKAGYDAVIVEGKAEKPIFLHVKDKTAEFVDAKDFWGLNSFETEKMLKAVIFESTGVLSAAHPRELKELSAASYREVMTKANYTFWKRQGTMSTIEWSQENSALPNYNYREGVFDEAEEIGGFTMEKVKVSNRGCPQCNMTCGNVIRASDRKQAELDYENVAMLGSNVGFGNLGQVAALNRIADELGLDTISLGHVLGFAMEASEKKLVNEKIFWGKFKDTCALINDIAYRRGLGSVLAEGVRFAAEKVGGGAGGWAVHGEGLV